MKWLKNLFNKKEVKKQDKTTKSYGSSEFKYIPPTPPRQSYQTVDNHNDLMDPTNIMSPLNPFSPISVWDHPIQNYSSPSYDSTSSQDYSSSDYSSSDYTSSYSSDSTSYDSSSSSYSCD